MTAARYQRIVSTLSRRQPDLSVAMENVHKTRNLGALARTCDAVGIGTIHAIAPEDTRVRLGHRTAGGTEKWVAVERHLSVSDAYEKLRGHGYSVLAAHLGPGTIDFRQIDYTAPTVVVVGSELDGLSVTAAMAADHRIHVPLMGMVQSLNVSVATAVILYEAARQREQAGLYSRRRISDEEYSRLLFEWLHPGVADYCRTSGKAYPRLDENGEICEPVSGNPRMGIKRFIETSQGY